MTLGTEGMRIHHSRRLPPINLLAGAGSPATSAAPTM